MIFRPVRPQSPIGPPITNRPVGFTKKFRCSVRGSYMSSGSTGSSTCSHRSSFSSDSAPSRCCVEINTFSIAVRTFGTEQIPQARIEELVGDRELFDLRPAAILRDLDLQRPIYAKTAAYGHFGRDDHDFTWERTDKADALREAAGVAVEAAL